MFRNKHVVIAMIVAPILSILAWIAVGQLRGEKPSLAVPGNSYPMVEKSNCRYPSGACDLENEDFQLRMTVDDTEVGAQLVVSASHTLDGVLVAVTPADAEERPVSMRPSGGQGLVWRLPLSQPVAPDSRIRLVASARGSTYFADASTRFLLPREAE